VKRYGALIGKREEYRLRLTDSEKKAINRESGTESRPEAVVPPLPVREGVTAPAAPNTESRPEAIVPPLPVREGVTAPTAPNLESPQPHAGSGQQPNDSAGEPSQGGVIVPPLPAAVPPLPGAQNNAGVAQNGDGNNSAAPGQFVANDLMDEGVKLLSKYKHGSTDEDVGGPGTRSRRAAVNVICVARCPLGGHFTTGSDDGICRVWADSNESGVATVDRRVGGNYISQNNASMGQQKLRSMRSGE
jgi:hypothetical protein